MNSGVSSVDQVSINAPSGLPESRNPSIMRALRGTAQARVEAPGQGKIISIQVNAHHVTAHKSFKRLGPEDKDMVLEQGQEALPQLDMGGRERNQEVVIEAKGHVRGDRTASLVALDSLCWGMAAGDVTVLDFPGFLEYLGQLWISSTLWRRGASRRTHMFPGRLQIFLQCGWFNY